MAIPNWLKQVAAILYDDAGNRIKAGAQNGLAVEGAAAAGAAIASGGNPILIAGKQNTNNLVDVALTNTSYSGILVAPGIAVTGADADPNAGASGVAYIETQTSLGKLAIVPFLFNGATWDRQRTPNVFKALNALSVATEATIWTPTTGKKFRLMGIYLQSSVAGNLLLRDNTAGTIIAVVPSGAGGDANEVLLGNGILSAAANNVLTCTGPAASTVSGMVLGTEE